MRAGAGKSGEAVLSARLDPAVLREALRVDHRHLARIGVFLALYAGAGAAAVLLARDPSWASLALRVPLYVLAAASLHGVSLFVHEGVHGVLSRSPALNRALSMACALPVAQNFAAYRVLHLKHHADTGGGDDPDDYRNYTSRGWLVFLMHWGRLVAGYPAYVTMIPILGLRQAARGERAWILLEVALFAAAAVLAALLVPREVLVHAWAWPMVPLSFMVNVRGMSQHTLLPEARHAVRGTRTILAGPVVRFFMCNENFHLEHHLYAQVPWYNLPRLHAALADDLRAQGAPYIPSYLHFVRVFVAETLVILRAKVARADA